MNKDRIKGKLEEIKGNVKQRIGGARRDRKTEGEGWLEEKKGQIRGGIGEMKDEARERRDPERHDPDRQL
jgi:uncharacterized protein YjbJ (UPF0337 family)